MTFVDSNIDGFSVKIIFYFFQIFEHYSFKIFFGLSPYFDYESSPSICLVYLLSVRHHLYVLFTFRVYDTSHHHQKEIQLRDLAFTRIFFLRLYDICLEVYEFPVMWLLLTTL